jgi:L-asparaginase II
MPVSNMLAGIPMVDVTRGERVESTHDIAACACDDTGTVLLECGTIDVPVFLRSAAKPFIAAAAVRAGVAERFGLTSAELAIMCASHTGEPLHLETAASILAKIGASVDDLQCGGKPTALHSNCSGKHAGILAFAAFRGEPAAGYLDAAHPVQREILAFCARVFGDPAIPERIGVDGCGIPAFAAPLRAAARTFARLATLRGFEAADRGALEAVRDAMAAHPWLVSGTGRFDTDLIAATNGSVVAKGGAEGVHASALRAPRAGLVLKTVDGAARAVPPAAIALLDRLWALDGAARERLRAHARPPIRNVAGRIVGEIRARMPDEATLSDLPASS